MAASVLDTNKKQEVSSLPEIINKKDFNDNVGSISELVDYAPSWVIFLISLSL
jgi:hypothetical protein